MTIRTRLLAALLFTFGVSSILFYGGLNLSLSGLRGVSLSLGLLEPAPTAPG